MLRLGDNIRLNSQEQATLSGLVGFTVNPTTVAAHDTLLARAGALFVATPGESDPEALAEARLMGAVLGRMALGA
jgi:hypothetical protein